ncbi:MAG: alpha-D-ribose 1-methylphosphonate 5-triphosphate diphosphatase [Rhodospirillales bacterium]
MTAFMDPETILTNAMLVLPNEVVSGTIAMKGATIVGIDTGNSSLSGAIDMQGDYLIPGIVDLHTDNLERQVQPRATSRWPSRSAMVAHDAQCAAAGVTTIFDSLCLGDLGFEKDRIRTFHEGLADLDALAPTGLLKSEHFLHLRCEVPAADTIGLVEPVIGHRLVRMISLMDHSPGEGQYANLDYYRKIRKASGLDDETIERRIHELRTQRARLRDPNRRILLELARGREVPIASHDDRTLEEVAENIADGITISEFPVTLAAANAAKAGGMQVIAGAPNIVRGGSHSGNVSASDLVNAKAVDAFASDYVPPSLVEAAFLCARSHGISLPAAIGMVTDTPARMAGLPERGRLALWCRADVVRVTVHENLPVVRQVWCGGVRTI